MSESIGVEDLALQAVEKLQRTQDRAKRRQGRAKLDSMKARGQYSPTEKVTITPSTRIITSEDHHTYERQADPSTSPEPISTLENLRSGQPAPAALQAHVTDSATQELISAPSPGVLNASLNAAHVCNQASTFPRPRPNIPATDAQSVSSRRSTSTGLPVFTPYHSLPPGLKPSQRGRVSMEDVNGLKQNIVSLQFNTLTASDEPRRNLDPVKATILVLSDAGFDSAKVLEPKQENLLINSLQRRLYAQFLATLYYLRILLAISISISVRLFWWLQPPVTAIIICLVLINVVISGKTLLYTGTRIYAISTICKSNVFFPYRNTVCTRFDTAWETQQHHDRVEMINGLKNANSKYEILLDNNIYCKQLPIAMHSIQDAIYSLRMNVKHSKLDTDIKSRLGAQLTTYIEMNEATIESTQHFLSGIAQTVDMILLQANATTRDLEIIKEQADKQPAADGIILNVVSWLARYHIAYLWGGIDPFLPVSYTGSVEIPAIVRLRKHISRITPEVSRDIARATENQERFSSLVEMAIRIQDQILTDGTTVLAEKASVIAQRQVWHSVLARLGVNMEDVANTEGKLAMLEVIIPVFKDAEIYYRHSRNDLTLVKNEYTNLMHRLENGQFNQEIKQAEAGVFSSPGGRSPAEITNDVKDVVKAIEMGAWSLQRAKDAWVRFQTDYSNALFGNTKASKKPDQGAEKDSKEGWLRGETMQDLLSACAFIGWRVFVD